MITMKIVEKKPKPTFWAKPTPNTRMNIGRKIDFGIENAKNNNGFTTSAKYRFSAIRNPTSVPKGTASANAASTSLAVTSRSLRTLARCSNSPSMASVSEADGSSRGLTVPVRDSTSHAANIAMTIARRAILIPRFAVILQISGFCRYRLELRGDHVLRRHDILQPAELGEVERQLHGVGYVRSRHVAVGLQLQDRIPIFKCRDV